MRVSKANQKKAMETLAGMIKPGDTIYTTLRHVSRSGMSRSIDVFVMINNAPRCISSLVSDACRISWDSRRHCVKMGGCGMDMGYSIMTEIGYALFPEGFECIGEGDERGEQCPSNDHCNGDRDYTPHHHKSGAYALRHAWL